MITEKTQLLIVTKFPKQYRNVGSFQRVDLVLFRASVKMSRGWRRDAPDLFSIYCH